MLFKKTCDTRARSSYHEPKVTLQRVGWIALTSLVAQPPLIPSNAAVSNKSSTLGSSAALKLRWMVHV